MVSTSLTTSVLRHGQPRRACLSILSSNANAAAVSSSSSSSSLSPCIKASNNNSDQSIVASSTSSTSSSSRRLYHVWASKATLPGNNRFNKSQIAQQNGLQQKHRLFSSNSKRDFYDVLGISKSADKPTIKKAYFKLAKQYHPDTNEGDKEAAEKFKEATEAYEILSDEKQRKLYDQFGHAGVDPNFQQHGGNPFGGAGGPNPFAGFDFGDGSFHFSSSSGGGPGGAQHMDAEDLFDAIFGGGARRRPRGPRRGADLQMQVQITFQEAVFGASKDLHLRYQVMDNTSGKVELKERDVVVDIPPGIDTGMNLRLSGQGAEGDPGAPRGNLLVQVIVEDDKYFIRDGADVHTEIPISLTQAVLGGTVDIKTLNGQVELKIPKGCQPDTKLMLRGKGIQKLHGASKGNQVVHLKIEIPKDITPRQEELLREFDQEMESSGMGISGRLAEAAGSAFSKFFGYDDDDDNNQKNKNSNKSKEDNDDDKHEDSDYEEKKEAAR